MLSNARHGRLRIDHGGALHGEEAPAQRPERGRGSEKAPESFRQARQFAYSL